MKELSFDTLYFFVTLAESQYFKEAADKLFITQQGLSKRIVQLEEELKTTLIERHHKGLSLTWEGQRFYERARDTLHQLQQLEHQFLPGKQIQRNAVLRIAGKFIPQAPVSHALKQALRTQPMLKVQLTQTQTHAAKMEADLLSGQLDCAFLLTPPRSEALVFQKLYDFNLSVVVPFAMRLLPWEKLPFVCYHQFGLAEYTDIFWPEVLNGVQIMGKTDLLTASQLCLMGKAALFIPRDFVRLELASKQMIWLEDFPHQTKASVYLVWNPAQQNPLVQHFVMNMRR